mmetsp:Transcript_35900/g.71126  ORF Transcript_35900/g.71126 Transcript_35900/m.71126 type:complete len:102 (-) Transcript_35900:226-531(-)
MRVQKQQQQQQQQQPRHKRQPHRYLGARLMCSRPPRPSKVWRQSVLHSMRAANAILASSFQPAKTAMLEKHVMLVTFMAEAKLLQDPAKAHAPGLKNVPAP